MAAELATYKLEAIKEARQLFEASIASDTFREFINRAIEDIDFYEGRQLAELELETLRQLGLKSLVTNLIAMRLDALAGKEVSTRSRFKYKARSGSPNEVMHAEALSHLAMYLQEKNRTSRILSQAKHYSRICGIGWHSFEVNNGKICEVSENPLDVIWDVRDHSPLLTNQGFVARVKWMTVDEAIQRFPKKKDQLAKAGQIDGFTGADVFGFGTNVSRTDSAWKMYAFNGYWNEKDKEVAVIEFQYREPAKYYRATSKDNAVIETFDYEEAKKFAANKSTILDMDGFKVCFAYWTGSLDLDWMESPWQIEPAVGRFLLTPVVHARQIRDGVPYGLVTKAKDPQRAYNTKANKISWLMAARQIIIDKGAVDDLEDFAANVNRPDGVFIINPGKQMRIEQHNNEIAQHYQALALHRQEIEMAMGIYDEALGVETNAQSGVAIQRRQTASSSTTMFAADGYNEAQKQVAEKMLWLIRAVFTDVMAMNITDDKEGVKTLKFNDDEDERKIDVRVGEFDVVMESIPDADTMNDLAREGFLELFRNGVKLEDITPGLLDIMNIPKSATLRKEVEAGVQKKMAELEQLKGQQTGLANGPQGQTPMAGGANAPIQTQQQGAM